MLIKYTRDSKSQTLRMRFPFQSTGRPISHRNMFRVYMIPLRDFVPEWNSRPGTTTGVNSRRGKSSWHDILWRYHVNKCRTMGGNRSKLAPARKSPRCHVNTPLDNRHNLGENIPLGQSRHMIVCNTAFFSVVTQRSSPQTALRDDTKNGCRLRTWRMVSIFSKENYITWPNQGQLNWPYCGRQEEPAILISRLLLRMRSMYVASIRLDFH